MKFLIPITFSLLLALTACGGNKVITTTDDSADYKTAKQLPPLNKSPQLENNSPELDSKSSQLVNNSSESATTSIQVSERSNNQSITTSIVDVSDYKRLLIDAPTDEAWPYFLTQLRTSTVTIHSRNNEATRVEVGCGSIDDGAKKIEKDGWLILDRENLVYEYCVMQLTESRGVTSVSVRNRLDEEVSASEAITLLSKVVSQ